MTAKRQEFPRGFQGVIGHHGQILTTEEPTSLPSPPPHIMARGIYLYRIENYLDLGRFDIWADYKGRGFWVVDLETHMDISGPIRINWRSLEVVLGGVAAVVSTRKHIQQLLGMTAPRLRPSEIEGEQARTPF